VVRAPKCKKRSRGFSGCEPFVAVLPDDEAHQSKALIRHPERRRRGILRFLLWCTASLSGLSQVVQQADALDANRIEDSSASSSGTSEVVEKGVDSTMVESMAEWGSEHVNLGLLSRRTLSDGLSLLLGQEPCDA
jgi:hypothetical protein